ncbi:MAG: ABC transporter ATP-binding protein/permease, partial [Planctomycetes bacterium]|nr:ABC transporter ATP-binding protein/permease [Planctomycetota bacterium]
VAGRAPGESLTLGDITAYVGYMWMFYGPLQWFTVIANWMNHAFASAERIFSVLDAQPEVYDPPAVRPAPKFRGWVEFRKVRFSYERGKEVIKGIDLDIRPGEMVGLVGKSGAGKSTIVNLLCRFFDVDSGEIRIDGHPIREFRLLDLRRQIGIVMQDPFLFRASLLENIRYGSPGCSFLDVVRAAKAAHAHEFIVNKEFGYDTMVGEGGITLSGGERQRIAIARAILHNPPILILDEATSSVDTETEKAIQDAIAELIRERTVIAIAHRLATLRNAVRLVVVDEGRIVEVGTHDELMLGNGLYANQVRTQTELNKLRAEANMT